MSVPVSAGNLVPILNVRIQPNSIAMALASDDDFRNLRVCGDADGQQSHGHRHSDRQSSHRAPPFLVFPVRRTEHMVRSDRVVDNRFNVINMYFDLISNCGVIMVIESIGRLHWRSFGRALMLVLAAAPSACGGSMSPAPTQDGAVQDGGIGEADGNRGEDATDASALVDVSDSAREVTPITDQPEPCTTSEGSPGLIIDIFPYPNVQPKCEPLNQPGAEDQACPSDWLIGCGSIDCSQLEMMPGCCRPDGFCGLLEQGYWGQDVALGCIDRNPWIDNMKWLDRPLAPVRCGD